MTAGADARPSRAQVGASDASDVTHSTTDVTITSRRAAADPPLAAMTASAGTTGARYHG
ncbi:hypothetical protein [Frankia sp. CiP1_Cm_nod2]|uniref:hypothetical protein n=1 Tax=Frankia sp. CiP1_Cm_nod2 TaxID=2897161 RepID=UPI0020258949